MGAEQSVNFKDYKTNNELNNFMNNVQETNKTIIAQNVQFQKTLDAIEPNKKAIQLANDLSDADCKCNAPKIVYWLSSKQRAECTQARMKAFTSFLDFTTSVVYAESLNDIIEKNKLYSGRLSNVVEVNKNIIG
jgi:hypothetical protein